MIKKSIHGFDNIIKSREPGGLPKRKTIKIPRGGVLWKHEVNFSSKG
jgi:hypothetical protein